MKVSRKISAEATVKASVPESTATDSRCAGPLGGEKLQHK